MLDQEEKKGGFKITKLKSQEQTASTLTQKTHTEGELVNSMLAKAVETGNMGALEKFLELRAKEQARAARIEFLEAKANFQRECPAIKKTNEVDFKHRDKETRTNYWYADLDTIIETVKSPLAASGLSYEWKTEEKSDGIKVTCILSHAGGHCESDTLTGQPDVSGGKAGIQAKASTITYLRRYTLTNVLGISSGGRDDDGRSAGSNDASDAVIVLPRPTRNQMIDAMKKIMSGEVTMRDIESLYHLTDEEREMMSKAKKS
ncbi:MAG: hypothetical protein EBW87_02045 [Burkholderiaceae bacterium]|nr:hypothetical protein [Burkholderiaceae bacterium]